jgi:hypothetical protein
VVSVAAPVGKGSEAADIGIAVWLEAIVTGMDADIVV